MIRHGYPPYLECSSRGDKRFSAFYARVNGLTIESIYQSSKVFEGDSVGWDTNTNWIANKGKPCINQEEVRQLYSQLWDRYIAENPHLLDVLKAATGLSDMFGQTGHACQATELWRIRNG